LRILLVDNEENRGNKGKKVRESEKILDKSAALVLELKQEGRIKKTIIITVCYYTCFTFIPTLPPKLSDCLASLKVGEMRERCEQFFEYQFLQNIRAQRLRR